MKVQDLKSDALALDAFDPAADQLPGRSEERSIAEIASSPEEDVTLLELLDRVLDKGIVLAGDITLSVADVDLVHVGLRVLLTSVETAQKMQGIRPDDSRGGAKGR